MQGGGPGRDAGASSRGGSSRKRGLFSSKAFVASAVVAACLAFSCVFLYTPAQQYYHELRERDRLQAEYAALQQRNEAIQNEVDYLSTNEGVEDRARREFGWVKSDEMAGSVIGVDVADDSSFRANIVPGSVPAPETWYSNLLDPIFGAE